MRRSRRRRVGGPQSDGGSLRPDTPQSQHATARQLGDGVASAQPASPCQNCRLQRLVSGLRKPGISRNAIRRCPHAPRRTIEAGRDSEGADARAFPRIKARRSKNLKPLWLAFVSFWVIRLVAVLSFGGCSSWSPSRDGSTWRGFSCCSLRRSESTASGSSRKSGWGLKDSGTSNSDLSTSLGL